ncbi:COQ9 family protein [Roseomonas elaeocarpi]|uniref:COQ9 family protein n=1 Tax=Roseomonas elaeocarpi TaxID=907779 RepID=A0ABV6JU64_9PROT
MILALPPVERSAERDALLQASLPHVARLGWTTQALREGAASLGLAPETPDWLFPRGGLGALEAWCDLADRRMAEGAQLEGLRTPGRIRALIARRIGQAAPHKEAVRQGLATLSLPWNARVMLRTTLRTADATWVAAGDVSTDLSRYTRRATLAALYGSVLAYWMADGSEDSAATLGFLDRQLSRLGRLQQRKPR